MLRVMSKEGYTEDDFYNEMWELVDTLDNDELQRIWDEKLQQIVKEK